MKRLTYMLTLAVGLLLAACGGPPGSNPLLSEAQRDYQAAQSDSQIVANAPVPLKQAEEALKKGEDMHQSGADAEIVTHYAYLAKQRTKIAKEKARLHAAEAEVERAELERKEALLAVREMEAKRSKAKADSAKAALRQAETQVTEAEMEARNAKKLAEEQAMEAEAAKAAARTAIDAAQALAAQVAELQARETDRGLVITLSDILFEFDKATLKPGADRTLTELASFLNEYEDRNLLIEGFTDSIGSDAYNEDLSKRRADAVRSALIAKGVDDTRIQTRGLGEDYPVASNDTEAGRQQNRRVEIVISDDAGQIPNRGG